MRAPARRALTAVALAASACASGPASVGPLRIEIPDGWRVTRSLDESLQLADGLDNVDQDAPGAARAVFDVYLNSPHTRDSYEALLEDNNTKPADEQELTLDGRTAYLIEYEADAFAGRQIAVIIPSEEIHIVYRAAKIRDNASFYRGRSAFLGAVLSIRFESMGSG